MTTFRRLATWSLLATAALASCLVPDVTLVDEFSNADAGGDGSGGSSRAGSTNAAGDGATASDGGDLGAGGAGEPAVGGSSLGVAGDAALAGQGGSSAGMAGAASGGSNVVGGPFAEVPVCEATPNAVFCEAFASDGPLMDWDNVAMADMAAAATGDAPSPPAFLQTGFKQATPGLSLPEAVKVGFWVRYPQQTDQHFISFGAVGLLPIKFGVEGDRFRFHYGGVQDGVVAPSSPAKTLVARNNVWTCVEIRLDATSLQARVVPLGQQAVELPIVDGVATTGEDDQWVPVVGSDYGWDGSWWFGNAGNDIHIDDVSVGGFDEPSTCEYYLQQSAQ